MFSTAPKNPNHGGAANQNIHKCCCDASLTFGCVSAGCKSQKALRSLGQTLNSSSGEGLAFIRRWVELRGEAQDLCMRRREENQKRGSVRETNRYRNCVPATLQVIKARGEPRLNQPNNVTSQGARFSFCMQGRISPVSWSWLQVQLRWNTAVNTTTWRYSVTLVSWSQKCEPLATLKEHSGDRQSYWDWSVFEQLQRI